jgi:hypothetical protein
MLHWTETEIDFVINQTLIDNFNEETTDEAFEKKYVSSSNVLMPATSAMIRA